MLDVEGYLSHLGSNALKEISRRRDLPYQGIGKAQQIRLLAPRLLDRQWLRAHLRTLSRAQKDALEKVRSQGGLVFALGLVKELEEEGVANPSELIRGLMSAGLLLYSQREVESAASNLDLWGRWGGSYGRADRELWLPPEVGALMGPPPESLKPPEPPAPLEEYSGSLESTRTPFASMVRDLFAIVQAVRAKPLSLTQAGYIRKPELNRLNKALAPSEPTTDTDDLRSMGRSDFAYQLCGPLALLAVCEEHAAVEARDEGLGFFSQPAAEQARLLLDAWLGHGLWNELIRAPGLEVAYGYGSDLPAGNKLTAARKTILGVLKEAEAGKWTSITSLLRVIQQKHVDFLFSRKRTRRAQHYYGVPDDDCIPYEGLYRRGTAYGRENRLDKRHHWGLVEGAYIVSVLTEPLLWLGFVEIGLGNNRQPVAVRLTPEGLAALGLDGDAASEPAEAQRALVVQPNLEMVLLPEVSGFGAAIELDRFADRVSADRAIIYRLSRDSLYRGLRGGLRLDEVIATLERLGRTDIPQNVRHSLQDWGGRFGAIRLRRRAAVVSAAEPAAVDAALKAAGIGDARRIAPTAAVLPDQPETRQALCRRAGARYCDYNTLPANVMNAEEDGRLVVPAKHLTPYLRYRLGAVAREVQPGTFVLDQALVRAAVRGGTRAPEIEQFLAGVATGPLPSRVRLALRGWGNTCRDVGLAPVTAIRADPEILDLLLALPELRSGVLARPAPAIALLDARHASAARALLDEFGIFRRDVLDAGSPASEGPLARAEPLYVLAAKDLRTVLQRAIDERRETVLLMVAGESYRPRVVTERVLPLGLSRSGSRYDLSARDSLGNTRTLNVAAIQAIRLLEPVEPEAE